MLSCKQHAPNTKAKINTRNNLLRKLTNSRWGLGSSSSYRTNNRIGASWICIFLDSTEARNTSKQGARTTLWVEEWNALGERSTEWRDKWIIPNEHSASGTDEPCIGVVLSKNIADVRRLWTWLARNTV